MTVELKAVAAWEESSISDELLWIATHGIKFKHEEMRETFQLVRECEKEQQYQSLFGSCEKWSVASGTQ